MSEEQLYDKIYEQKDQLQKLISEYWHAFSGVDTWYFWFNIASVIIPLLILYFVIDRKRLFEICFFGYTIHVLWINIGSSLSSANYFVYPHSLTYIIPTGVNIAAVLLPITFMLLYQYCMNYKKNFYVVAIIGALVFAYGFGSFSLAVDLLKVNKGMNLTYLFFIDVAVSFIAYWFTKLFLWFRNKKAKA
ncbi:hypothetical protein [Lentibacillus sp. Marseille-P4043]|uniref:hypothetical protein n=1 Tax=Lentibacillus sp. Marseille-P4043 TaxID=2040293 RepID=UPI000D0B0ED6|nr:hypothetical protein [Lentibacillus sp. Marseille-P4043]